LILFNKEIEVSIEIEKTFLNNLMKEGRKHYPKEFGGFLIGYYSEDQKVLRITKNIFPKKYYNTSSLFIRNSEGIESDLKKLHSNTPSEYYIGEWHTHPNGSSMYSNTDLNAMKKIVQCSSVQIKNPILLILSIMNDEARDFSFYLFNDNKLSKYEK